MCIRDSDDDGKLKGKLHRFVVIKGAGSGFGEGETVFGANFVKTFLDGKAHEKLLAYTLKAVIGTEFFLIADQKFDVIIAAGNQKQSLFLGVAGGEFDEGVTKNSVILEIRLYYFYRDDAAVGCGAKMPFSDGDGRNSVSLVEGAGHAVYVDVAAEQDGDKILCLAGS